MNITELNDILNGWPNHCLGYAMEKEVIEELNRLGELAGYGRLSQLAGYLYEIQCFNKSELAVTLKRDHFRLMGWELPKSLDA